MTVRYRELEPGEIIAVGDEYQDVDGSWLKVETRIGTHVDHFDGYTMFRRPLGNIADAGAPTDQERIAQALRDRGYAQGYTSRQYAARQWLKTVEELAEAGDHLSASRQCAGAPAWFALRGHIDAAAAIARGLFDEGFAPDIDDAPAYIAELADVITPPFVAAQELGTDLIGLAVEQAEENVKRGVR